MATGEWTVWEHRRSLIEYLAHGLWIALQDWAVLVISGLLFGASLAVFSTIRPLAAEARQVAPQQGQPQSQPEPVTPENPWHGVAITSLFGLFFGREAIFRLRNKSNGHSTTNLHEKIDRIDLSLHGNGTEDNPGIFVRVMGMSKDIERLRADLDRHLVWAEKESSDLVRRINGIKDSGS